MFAAVAMFGLATLCFALSPVLPLSMLATLGLQPEDEAACASILAMIRTSALLDRDHFLPLVNAPTPAGALDEVAAHPGRYFPFSYR